VRTLKPSTAVVAKLFCDGPQRRLRWSSTSSRKDPTGYGVVVHEYLVASTQIYIYNVYLQLLVFANPARHNCCSSC
jgi:hypothetical protein